MDRTYEVMFIVRPDMVEEELDKLISNLEAAVTGGKGTVKSVERWASAGWRTSSANSWTAFTS